MSQAAHFLSRSKKDIVDTAVCEYIDAHRGEINAGIKAALGQLNGTDAAAVSLMTGFSAEGIDDLGGLPACASTRPGVGTKRVGSPT